MPGASDARICKIGAMRVPEGSPRSATGQNSLRRRGDTAHMKAMINTFKIAYAVAPAAAPPFEHRRPAPTVKAPRDKSVTSDYWIPVENRIRFVAWFLVILTAIADVAVTFG